MSDLKDKVVVITGMSFFSLQNKKLDPYVNDQHQRKMSRKVKYQQIY